MRVAAVAKDVGISPQKVRQVIDEIHDRMMEAAKNLEFEEAARLRDRIKALQDRELRMRE